MDPMKEDPEMRRAIDRCSRATTAAEAEVANAAVMELCERDRDGCTCDAFEFTDELWLGFGVLVSDRHVTHHPNCARVRLEPHRFHATRTLAELPWWERLSWWARQPKSSEYDALPPADRLRRVVAVVFRGRL